MAPPASVCGAIASDSRGLRHRAEGVGSNRGRLFRRRRALSLGMLGKGIVKRCTERIQQYTYVRTLGGGTETNYVCTYVRSLEMSPRSAGWEGEQRETTAVMYARLYVRKDVPTYVLTQVLTYVRTSSRWAQTHSTKKRTYVRMYIHTNDIHTNVHTYVREAHRSPPLWLPISRLSMRTAVCFCEPPFWIPVRLTMTERNVSHMPDLGGEKQPVGKVASLLKPLRRWFKRQPFPQVRTYVTTGIYKDPDRCGLQHP